MLSVVAIQGAGASAATITAPSGWTAVTPTWPCSVSPPDWTASNSYTNNSVILPTVGNPGGYSFQPSGPSCTSGATEPATWNQTIDQTTSDHTCTWVNEGVGIWEVQIAAAWRIATASDGPLTSLTWGFSGNFLGSVVNTVYTNVSSSTPIDVVGSPVCLAGPAGAFLTASAVKTSVDNDMLVGLFGAAGTGQDLLLLLGHLTEIAREDDFAVGPVNSNTFISTRDPFFPQAGVAGWYGPFTKIPPADWTASHNYAAGTAIVPTVGNPGGYAFNASAFCTSGASEPGTWNQTNGQTTSDGTCIWTNTGPADFSASQTTIGESVGLLLGLEPGS